MDDSVSRVLIGLIPRLFRFAQLRKKKSSYSRTMIPIATSVYKSSRFLPMQTTYPCSFKIPSHISPSIFQYPHQMMT